MTIGNGACSSRSRFQRSPLKVDSISKRPGIQFGDHERQTNRVGHCYLRMLGCGSDTSLSRSATKFQDSYITKWQLLQELVEPNGGAPRCSPKRIEIFRRGYVVMRRFPAEVRLDWRPDTTQIADRRVAKDSVTSVTVRSIRAFRRECAALLDPFRLRISSGRNH